MEKKAKKGSRFTVFLKKNIYYILMIVCVLAIGAIITVAAVKNKPITDDPIVTPPIEQEQGEQPVIKPEVKPQVFVINAPIVDGEVIMIFDSENLQEDITEDVWRVHKGIDYKAPLDTNVLAVFDGTVESVTEDEFDGTTIIIKHQDGFKSVYKLLSNPAVSAGDKVTKSTVIGKVGTGLFESKVESHIHFELFQNDVCVNPNLYFAEGDK